MKVDDLLSDIEKRNLVLPEFQREYVWGRDQARQLLVSLIKGYPVGSFLFWKTDSPPELKNVKTLPEKLGSIQVILDGQQRLTTLYLLIRGTIPPYYTEKDIKNDPRALCFNLHTGELQYYQRIRMKSDPLWCRVVDCFDPTKRIDVFKIAKEAAGGDDEKSFELAERYNENLNSLRAVRNVDIPVQLVPPRASVEDAIDIFDRTNSLGTKLTDAELALTHITAKWPEARRTLKGKIAQLESCHFSFDLTFMTRALTAVVTKRALYDAIHGQPRDELMKGWNSLKSLLDYIVGVLPSKAHIHSTEDLTTSNVLIPLLVYLDLQGGAFPDEQSSRHAIHWLYAAQMWARYTAQTDQRLEHDVSIVQKEHAPWKVLCDQIVDQRGRLEVKPGDLEGRWITHPLFRMAIVVAKAQGAVDWFNGAPLSTVFGKRYQLHAHHIFPQGALYRDRYDLYNHLHRKMVNEIANRAFLTARSNLMLQDTLPEQYLPVVERKYPGALAKQFVPMNPELWRIDRFEDFLAERRRLIAAKINEFMNSLILQPQPHRPRSIAELKELGESATLEFKSTLRWDVVQNRVNKQLQYSTLKTIAAFLNSDGGTLIIGLDDAGGIVGLDHDLKTLHNGNKDTFQQTLVNLIVNHIGAEFAPLIKTRFEQLEGKTVCAVEVEPAHAPAYVSSPDGKAFYVRAGNTSRALDPEETVSYINAHWH